MYSNLLQIKWSLQKPTSRFLRALFLFHCSFQFPKNESEQKKILDILEIKELLIGNIKVENQFPEEETSSYARK